MDLENLLEEQKKKYTSCRDNIAKLKKEVEKQETFAHRLEGAMDQLAYLIQQNKQEQGGE